MNIKRLIKALEQDVSFFPSELGDMPLITIKGDNQFTIENVYQLKKFSKDAISMASAGKRIEITGENIKIKTMLKEELVVEGKLDAIRFL